MLLSLSGFLLFLQKHKKPKTSFLLHTNSKCWYLFCSAEVFGICSHKHTCSLPGWKSYSWRVLCLIITLCRCIAWLCPVCMYPWQPVPQYNIGYVLLCISYADILTNTCVHATAEGHLNNTSEYLWKPLQSSITCLPWGSFSQSISKLKWHTPSQHI